MVKVRKFGMMDPFMKVSGKLISNKDKENLLVLIKEYILEVGEIINYMVKVNLHGPMARNLQVNTNLI